jgi:hypothetical protein
VYSRVGTLGNLFNSWYGATAADAPYADVDAGETYGGDPSVFFTYRSAPNKSSGWYSYTATPRMSMYSRQRFKLASTFDPISVGFDGDGFVLSQIFMNFGTYVDNSKLAIVNGRTRLAFYQHQLDDYVEIVDLGDSAAWQGTQLQIVHGVEVYGTKIRTRVWLGAASDALSALTLIADKLYTPSYGAVVGSYDINCWDWWFTRPASNDFKAWLFTAEFGTFVDGTSGTYATVVNGVVTATATGIKPSNTPTTVYVSIPAGDPTPSVGDYYSDICGTFSASVPTIPPGQIAPPYTPGTTPPTPGTPGYPVEDVPTNNTNTPSAPVVPSIITFSTDAGSTLTVSAVPAALTALSDRYHVAADLTDVCALRLQGRVTTPCPGAIVALEYSSDGATGWTTLGTRNGEDGPYIDVGSSGYVRGLFVAPVATGDVVLRLVTQDGDGVTNLVLGHVSVLMYVRADNAVPCPALPDDGCTPVDIRTLSNPNRGPRLGAIVREDFREYCRTNFLDVMSTVGASRWWNEPSTAWSGTITDADRARFTIVRSSDDSVRGLYHTYSSTLPFGASQSRDGIDKARLWLRQKSKIESGFATDYVGGMIFAHALGDGSGGVNYCAMRAYFVNAGGNATFRTTIDLDTGSPPLEQNDTDLGVSWAAYMAANPVVDQIILLERTAGAMSVRVWLNGVDLGTHSYTAISDPPQTTFDRVYFNAHGNSDGETQTLLLREIYDADVNSDPYNLLP